MSPSIALNEVMFATALVSDGSTSKYQTRHVSNTPTNSSNESLSFLVTVEKEMRGEEAETRGKRNVYSRCESVISGAWRSMWRDS